MADSGFQTLEVDPETLRVGRFRSRFEVSWRSLTEPEIEPPEITGDTGTKPPETAPPEGEPFKPPFSDSWQICTSGPFPLEPRTSVGTVVGCGDDGIGDSRFRAFDAGRSNGQIDQPRMDSAGTCGRRSATEVRP
jgi:hypothetical protein